MSVEQDISKYKAEVDRKYPPAWPSWWIDEHKYLREYFFKRIEDISMYTVCEMCGEKISFDAKPYLVDHKKGKTGQVCQNCMLTRIKRLEDLYEQELK